VIGAAAPYQRDDAFPRADSCSDPTRSPFGYGRTRQHARQFVQEIAQKWWHLLCHSARSCVTGRPPCTPSSSSPGWAPRVRDTIESWLRKNVELSTSNQLLSGSDQEVSAAGTAFISAFIDTFSNAPTIDRPAGDPASDPEDRRFSATPTPPRGLTAQQWRPV
jgi:hypothetical protein